MKRIFALLLVAALGTTITACAKAAMAETAPQTQPQTHQTEPEPETEPETKVETEPESETERQTEPEPETERQTEPESEQHVTGHGTTVEGLKAQYGIDDTYRETVDKDFNGCTVYYYEKVDKNGVLNIYDALNVTVDNESGEVFTFKRFDHPAFLEPVITEDEARAAAKQQYGKYGNVKDCQLAYYMPDLGGKDIYLAYTVTFDDEYAHLIYINAQDGSVLGGDAVK